MKVTWKQDYLAWMDMHVGGLYYGWAYKRYPDGVTILAAGNIIANVKTVKEARAYLIAMWALRDEL